MFAWPSEFYSCALLQRAGAFRSAAAVCWRGVWNVLESEGQVNNYFDSKVRFILKHWNGISCSFVCSC